jgi:hypothetical protein
MMDMEQRQNDESDHRGKVASAVEARQGVISGRILLVLLTSLLLVVITLAVSYQFMHN